MLNFFDHNNKFITPAIADKFSAGEYLSMLADVIGAKYIIPFSTFHEYQRDDSIQASYQGSQLQHFSALARRIAREIESARRASGSQRDLGARIFSVPVQQLQAKC